MILAGDVTKCAPEDSIIHEPMVKFKKLKTVFSESALGLDNFLKPLVSTVKVDILPGRNDPAPHALPQDNLHRIIVRESSQFESLCLSPNPHAFTLDDVLYMFIFVSF